MDKVCSNNRQRKKAKDSSNDSKERQRRPQTKSAIAVLPLLLRAALVLLLAAALIPIRAAIAPRSQAFANDTVEYVCGEVIKYNTLDAFTHNMKCDGVPAFCIDPTLTSPPSGTYAKQPLDPTGTTLENFRALLWFGWGGPGFDPSMWPTEDYYGEPMNETTYYIISHLTDSYFYYYNNTARAINCLNSIQNSWIRDNIFGWKIDRPYDDFDSDTFANRCFARASEVPEGFECFLINPSKATQSIVGFVPTGTLRLSKSSAYTSFTANNPLYRLQGITYDIYSDEGCTSFVGSLTCDSSGNSSTMDAVCGTYYAKEQPQSCSGCGFAADAEVHRIEVMPGRDNILQVSDRPQYCIPEAWVCKADKETGGEIPLGAASLEGAEFKVDYYAGYYTKEDEAVRSGSFRRSWTVQTDADGIAGFSPATIVSGDAPYTNDAGEMVIPLGTVVIREITAPLGYTLENPETFVLKVESAGTAEKVGGFLFPTQPDRVKRGDLEFVKVSESGMQRLAGIPFRLTSETTGESHIVVTDENGYYSSEASWISHTAFTNANDDAGNLDSDAYNLEAGTWFSGSADTSTEPDDRYGALPFDTYTLEELPCSGNSGLELVKVEHISVKRDAVAIDLGTIIDPAMQTQYISTSAYHASDLDKSAPASEQCNILDAVEYMNLTPGKEYTLVTQLADAASGRLLEDADGPITCKKTFTADASNGKLAVDVVVDTSEYAGSQIVFYERLYDGDILLAEDVDEGNTDQTVRIVGPSLATQAASSSDGTKQISALHNAVITDSVSYSELAAGEEYTVKGSLMYIEPFGDGSAHPVLDGEGNPIASTVSFCAQSASGNIDISFGFDSTGFAAGTRFVVFEELFQNGNSVAVHADENDGNQTVILALPTLQTAASAFGSSEKIIPASTQSTAVDRVSYENLEPGASYKVISVLIDKKTGYPLIADAYTQTAPGSASPEASEAAISVAPSVPQDIEDFYVKLLQALGLDTQDALQETPSNTEAASGSSQGDTFETLPRKADTESVEKLLTASSDTISRIPFAVTEFTPESPSGYLDIALTSDTSGLIGSVAEADAVAFEYLIRDDTLLAMHADADDTAQSVYFVPAAIVTVATDASDGDHAVEPGMDATVTDNVYYAGLIPGTQYTLTGLLVDKGSGDALFQNGEAVTSTVDFIPQSPDGSIDISFSFNTESMDGMRLVAFEYLSADGYEVASHTDIDSEDQTVVVAVGEGTPLPQTGDMPHDIRWLAALFLLGGAVCAASAAIIGKRSRIAEYAAKRHWKDSILQNIADLK